MSCLRWVLSGALLLMLQGAAADTPAYTTCPWNPDPEATPLYIIECVTFDVPLNYSEPEGRKIPFHVTHVYPKDLPVYISVWFLNGGPGTPGEWLLPYVSTASPAMPLEFFLPDHRGTGLSYELSCPDGSQELTQECIDFWKDNQWVANFNPTNAARDVHHGLTALNSGKPIYVFGTSYGTTWANRYMALYPTGLAGLVMESVAHPQHLNFGEFDIRAAEAAEHFLALCDEYPQCSQLWQGKTTKEAVVETIHQLEAGTQACAIAHFPFLTGAGAQRVKGEVLFREMFQVDTFYRRVAIFGFIKRLRRCNEQDVADLNVYVQALGLTLKDPLIPTIPGMPGFVRQSMIVNTIIQTSEGWWAGPNTYSDSRPTVEHCAKWDKESWISSGASLRAAEYTAKGFPTYEPDEYYQKIGDPEYPVLLINGDHDISTPFSEVFKLKEARPHWYLAKLPHFGHSPSAGGAIGVTCPIETLVRFLMDPSSDPTVNSCLDQLPRLSFVHDQLAAVAQKLFGSEHIFGKDTVEDAGKDEL